MAADDSIDKLKKVVNCEERHDSAISDSLRHDAKQQTHLGNHDGYSALNPNRTPHLPIAWHRTGIRKVLQQRVPQAKVSPCARIRVEHTHSALGLKRRRFTYLPQILHPSARRQTISKFLTSTGVENGNLPTYWRYAKNHYK